MAVFSRSQASTGRKSANRGASGFEIKGGGFGLNVRWTVKTKGATNHPSASLCQISDTLGIVVRNCCEELNCWNCPRTPFIAHKRDGAEPCSYKPCTSREAAGNFIIIDIYQATSLLFLTVCLYVRSCWVCCYCHVYNVCCQTCTHKKVHIQILFNWMYLHSPRWTKNNCSFFKILLQKESIIHFTRPHACFFAPPKKRFFLRCPILTLDADGNKNMRRIQEQMKKHTSSSCPKALHTK